MFHFQVATVTQLSISTLISPNKILIKLTLIITLPEKTVFIQIQTFSVCAQASLLLQDLF